MDLYEAIKYIYQSYVMAQPHIASGLLDLDKRQPGYCRQLLRAFNLDGKEPPTVSITGSKGKGSSAAIIASLFQGAGYRTGLFTGPHLVDFCERVRVDWQKIPGEEFLRLLETVKPKIEEIQATLPPDHYLGPVGIVLAIALLWFRELGTEINVLECGRGALVDDVNVVTNRWSVLTPIMMEHQNLLGPSLLDIAANKAALVKPGQDICISHRQEGEVTRLLKSLCGIMAVPLKMEGEDFQVEVVEADQGGCTFTYSSPLRRGTFSVPLAGKFQAYNAGAAIALVEEVKPDICDRVIRKGLAAVRWPGRCQFIPGVPPLILDGAINASSAAYLKELLDQRKEPLYMVLAVPTDKDWRGVVSTLAPLAKELWFTEANNPHLAFPSETEALGEGRKFNRRCSYIASSDAAMDGAVEAAGHRGIVVVAGTMSLLRDAISYSQSRLGRVTDETSISFPR